GLIFVGVSCCEASFFWTAASLSAFIVPLRTSPLRVRASQLNSAMRVWQAYLPRLREVKKRCYFELLTSSAFVLSTCHILLCPHRLTYPRSYRNGSSTPKSRPRRRLGFPPMRETGGQHRWGRPGQAAKKRPSTSPLSPSPSLPLSAPRL